MERGIGQWKRRFHVLHSEIRVTPPAKVCKLVFVCAVLHNICKERNIQLLLEEDEEPAGANAPMAEGEDADQDEPPPAARHAQNGLVYRDEFARLHFK